MQVNPVADILHNSLRTGCHKLRVADMSNWIKVRTAIRVAVFALRNV